MPKRTDLETILIIGAGPIVIGQACEFDYSGVQACRALKDEGYRVVLVNSNPATIMTDPEFADSTYIEPIRWRSVAEIIKVERPDAILPTMGGQTGLNCALDLVRNNVLEQYGVELIGATRESIDKAEDREKFRQCMDEIGLEYVRGSLAHSMEDALQILSEIGFPAIIRPSFTLGGSGGGIAYNRDEFMDICLRGLRASPTSELLIEESISGWKEFEMEVVRDNSDNCIIVCSIENLDAMGLHTGDSITIAPAQTLTDKEYQRMRDASIAVMRVIGVDTGGSNVQFAINPQDGRMVIIEMNPRVSRSSALASKATGFPIAKVAAKLAVGYTLDELHNDITGGATPASFEPTIDYIVTKIPRFDFQKFPHSDATLTTQMKSVGEVMAIGRTFQESLQKAIRSLEIGTFGFETPRGLKDTDGSVDDLMHSKLSIPGAGRLWYIGEAFRRGMSVDRVNDLTGIDPWFLAEIQHLIDVEEQIRMSSRPISVESLSQWKQQGFSDHRLGDLLGCDEAEIRTLRYSLGIHPVYKRVDSCAGEFDTPTAYMYSTYESECESNPDKDRKIVVLGGGPNRIGQGIEFDYCCVHAAMALREDGYQTIMVNCNPETVSTDYDVSDRLYFEPLTVEDVLEVCRIESPDGVIVQYGGQTPLKIARELTNEGVNIIGTSANSIHLAEDRKYFQDLLHKLDLRQPPNSTAVAIEDALNAAETIGYPLVVRPSYVLGGRAMEIVRDSDQLQAYMGAAIDVSHDSPVLLDKFLSDAIEVDVDAICDGEEVFIGGIMQHIELAGVHSGDSSCSLPAFSLTEELLDGLRQQTREMAFALNVIGLMNVQFAIKGAEIYVLEVNPRASRTVPFVSKATSIPLAKVGARCMLGQTLRQQGVTHEVIPSFFSVKEAVFPFEKFPGSEPLLGPEMKSTGEVMGIGRSFGEAYWKAFHATGYSIAESGNALLSVSGDDQAGIIEVGRVLAERGYTLYGTDGTAKLLSSHGIDVSRVNKVREGRPHVVDMLKNNEIDLIVNVPRKRASVADSETILKEALKRNVAHFTTISAAKAICAALADSTKSAVPYRLQTLHKEKAVNR
ncbi:MAG: carbamoyl-phosphate synthase large subunit [Acidiferrobacterales bacterium]|nr:carbamoyl-phosphate synthase large subunit [Acidiferrobacterales bacterium]